MKNGFTLVELLGVIILLGLIVTFVSFRVIDNSRKSLSETQEKTIIEAAKKYGIVNSAQMPTSTEKKVLCLSKLANEGYLDSKNLSNPETGAKLNKGCVVVTCKDTTTCNQYKYVFQSECSQATCS